MKNTMKKLLCMALAIMLLVSAVPFAAMAEDAYTVNVNIKGYGEMTVQAAPTDNMESLFNWVAPKVEATDVTVERYWWTNEGAERGAEAAAGDAIPGNGTLTIAVKANGNTDSGNDNQTTGKVTVQYKLGDTAVETKEFDAPASYSDIVKGYAPDGAKYALKKVFNGQTDKEMATSDSAAAGATVYVRYEKKTAPVTVRIKVGTSDTIVKSKTEYYAVDSTLVLNADLLPTGYKDREISHWWISSKGTVNNGVSYTITTEDLQKGVTIDARLLGESTADDDDDDKEVTIRDEEFMDDIYLYIYVNNDIISPAKRILLNNYSIIGDHTINKSDVLTVVDDYYKATDSNKGIIWKGMYRETGDITALNFVTGNGRDDDIRNLDVIRSDGKTDIIKVRVTGVTAKTSSTADSSNPKTGDTIMVPVMVAGLTASALAVAYVFGKKRFAR